MCESIFWTESIVLRILVLLCQLDDLVDSDCDLIFDHSLIALV